MSALVSFTRGCAVGSEGQARGESMLLKLRSADRCGAFHHRG
ncbi:hypothetical protein I553_4376 [Mycobacterium xenopi 4042]|uniref:Uncharacterized protein n=1 Tax=Mycobacterium xenopi 4042 TaxID=1299334 RepID=X8AGX1_MYCXE|nr:hypothetical protein I553_4376 [Mycobacterium xenopi 4042]